MGISHPLSDEFYGGPRGGVGSALLLSPERTPPSSPPPPASCCSAVDDQDFLEHEVSRMDTLADIAIKYGVEISDIKRANSLVTDSQMYAHKALLIPLPGRPMPSSVKLNGSSLRSKRVWAPNNQQNRDIVNSLAMSSLQSYYGLSSQRGDDMDLSTEMSLYSKGSSQGIGSEILSQILLLRLTVHKALAEATGRPKKSKMVPYAGGRKWRLIPRMTFCRTQLRRSKVFCRGLFPVCV